MLNSNLENSKQNVRKNRPHRQDLPPAPTPEYDATLGYYRGEPWTDAGDGKYYYSVPDIPPVHEAYVEIPDNEGRMTRSTESLTVLTAHGFEDEAGGWAFKDSRPIKAFIDKYNANNQARPIMIVAVCNPSEQQHETVSHVTKSAVNVSGYKEGEQTVVSVSSATVG